MTEPVLMQVFSDYVCAECYFSTARIERLKREHFVRIEWVHFPMHPDTPSEGRPIADLDEEIKARLDAQGLAYGKRAMLYNTRLAQELGKWADTEQGGEAIHDALFRAYFVDARDISQPAVLLDIAKAVALPLDAAREVLEQRTFRDAVDADWKLAREYGISGVPSFVCGRYGAIGTQAYAALEQLVREAEEPIDE